MMVILGIASFSISTAAHADDGDPKRGHVIAKKYCSPCHAVEAKQEKSPVADAPPFRTFASKWPLEDIEEALAEGIMVGHEGVQMPVFELDPPAIADLIAYLRSIQDPAAPVVPSKPAAQ
ncbi:MAG: cytochrome c [Alphaproteobacteria bacterium]